MTFWTVSSGSLWILWILWGLLEIERWFRTYDLEHARFQFHWKFVEYYNYERPHMALDYSTPAEVYYRDVQDVLG
jgi:transposase InsO family protein